MDNPKAKVKKSKTGLGVFAMSKINKGEIIACVDGKILGWNAKWTNYQRGHAIQFARKKWRLSNGFAVKLNHSCEPNCGIKNLFDIVAMRDIKKGEELTWDYEMTEASENKWSMKCKCGTKTCRKIISNYNNMPASTRKKYRGFISQWLIDEYGR